MKFGLILNTQFVAEEDPVVKVRDLVEQVRLARDHGFDSICVSHHYLLTPFQMPQPLPILGRLAPETGRMRLVTNIFLLTIHTPAYVAEQVATLDVLTEGRVTFGVGLGYRPEEFEAMGVEMKTRVSRFVELLEVAKRLWTEDVVIHRGRHFTLTNASLTLKPVQRPHPPIWIAASNDPAFERAARYGDGVLINPHASLKTVERQMGLYRRALDEAGHHRVTLTWVSPDGSELWTSSGDLEIGPPPTGAIEMDFPLILTFDLPIPIAGTHRLNVVIDDELQAEVPIHARVGGARMAPAVSSLVS